MDKRIGYAYRGFTINKSQKLVSGDVVSFEFRNKGTNDVTVNGILLQPTDTFKEVQNYNEKVDTFYEVIFSNPNDPTNNILVVIEKRYTKRN